MDVNGNGVLVERAQLNKAMALRSDTYTFDKFRYACILSGCDYVPSLPGIGLAKATKVFQLSRQTDVAMVTDYYYNTTITTTTTTTRTTTTTTTTTTASIPSIGLAEATKFFGLSRRCHGN